jgi:hypothetical protein
VLPPELRERVATALKEAGAQKVQVAMLDGRAAHLHNNLQWLFTPPAAGAPEWQREAWDKYMAPLLYPPGHPKEGGCRDSVSASDIQAAAMPIAEQVYPKEYLDQPMLYVPEKRINYNELNQAAARLYNREDPASAKRFYDWLVAAPEDPDAYPSDFWLPAEAGQPDAITHREWLQREIARQASVICSAGS